MNIAYGITIICVALMFVIVSWRLNRIGKVTGILDYLLYEELRVRASGVTDEELAGVVGEWHSMDELGYGTEPKLMWFRSDEGHMSLAFTDGKESWWPDGTVDPTSWALIHEGSDKVAIRVEFDYEDETPEHDSETASDKITIGGEVPLDTITATATAIAKEENSLD